MEEPFVLKNDPPPQKRKKFGEPKASQSVLFAGMECQPGQKDLFQTDGQQQPIESK